MFDEKDLILEAKHITRRFPASGNRTLLACNDVNLKMYKGKTLGLVGESGCGKSTFMRFLVSLDKPSEGEIIYRGKDITKLKGEELRQNRQNIQMVFQDPSGSFNPKMKIRDIICEPLLNFNRIKPSEKDKVAKKFLKMVELPEDFADRYPHNMSGGQRQRVAIARAIALEPEIIVMDEATCALDVSVQKTIIELIVGLQKKKNITIGFIAHDLGLIQSFAHQIAVMYLGNIVEVLPGDEIDVNVNGFKARTVSVSAADGKNLNRVFPGDPNGTYTDKLAYFMEKELFSIIDYYIDVHNGDWFEDLSPFIYCVGNGSRETTDKSIEMAKAADVPYYVISKSKQGGAYNRAGILGIPSVLLERGCYGLWSPEEVFSSQKDVRNILRSVGAFESSRFLNDRQNRVPRHMTHAHYIDASKSGCWFPQKRAGQVVSAGELVGVMKDNFGNVIEEVRLDEDAVILYQTVSYSVPKDTPLVAYGHYSECVEGEEHDHGDHKEHSHGEEHTHVLDNEHSLEELHEIHGTVSDLNLDRLIGK